jgi:transcriptional regulator
LLAATASPRHGRTFAFEIVFPAAGSDPRHSFSKQRDLIRRLPRKQEPVMYTPPKFQADRTAALAFAQGRGFATVCAWDRGKPVASALPFCLEYSSDGTPRAAFHVARGNALAALADGKSNWLIAVNGADAYVSADWYASPDQVPTWLYQAVHLTGSVRVMADGELGPHLDALSAKFESWLAPKPPWTSTKMTAGRLDAMKKAIVGLVMAVDDVEGSFKLNQHKSDVDHAAVMAALAQQGDPAAQQLARIMGAMRPQAFATETIASHEAATLEGESDEHK